MKRITYILTLAAAALTAMSCTKGNYEPANSPKEVEVEFCSQSSFSVSFTRANENTFGGVIGARGNDAWELTPESVTFEGLTGNATTPQTITTSPETVTLPTGAYTFVSCAISGNGSVNLQDDKVTLTGGAQTTDNDVVWAQRTATVRASEDGTPFGVEFNYGHVFSAVRFELSATGIAPDELMIQTSIEGVGNLGLVTDGVLDILSGEVTAGNTLLADDIEWRKNYLVVPTTSTAGELCVVYRGTEYKGTLSPKVFEAGRRTVISITLNTSTLGFTATVKDWDEIIDDSLTLE